WRTTRRRRASRLCTGFTLTGLLTGPLSHEAGGPAMMLSSLKQLDALLRGHSTQPALLQQGAAELSLKRLLTMSLILGGLYGFFMGWYAVTTRDAPDPRQLLASTLKLPLLFLLTLVVTFP